MTTTQESISLVPMSPTVWVDESIGASVELMIPKGTTLIKCDLSTDLVFVSQKQEALALYREFEAMTGIESDLDANMATQLAGKIQRSIRALEKTRKAYKDPIDSISKEVQSTFTDTKKKDGLLDLLKKAKNGIEQYHAAWEHKIIADRKAREAAAAKPSEDDMLNPEYQPPKTINAPQRPLTTTTDSGTRFHRKVVSVKVADESKLPDEFWLRVVDHKKLQTVANQLAENVNEPAIIRRIPGIEIVVEYRGQIRS